MSNKTLLIIDRTTGTVLEASDCYVVNPNDFPEEVSNALEDGGLSDSEISDIAENYGTSLKSIGSDTGWGDNKYRWTISYSPASVQEELEELLSQGYFEEEDPELGAIRWYLHHATREQRELVSNVCLSYDHIWQEFRSHLLHVLVEVSTEESLNEAVNSLLTNKENAQ